MAITCKKEENEVNVESEGGQMTFIYKLVRILLAESIKRGMGPVNKCCCHLPLTFGQSGSHKHNQD